MLADYGQCIAATTAAIKNLLAAVPGSPQITARNPVAARRGIKGASVNLFLYWDELVRYRSGNQPHESAIAAELHYLVTAYPGEDTDPDAASQAVHGNGRAAIENTPVVSIALPGGLTRQVQFTTTSLTLADLTSLWVASASPLRLSFGISAQVALAADQQ